MLEKNCLLQKGSRMKEKVLLKSLHKAFGPKIVLNGVDLEIYEGEIICVIGKSGTGKSVIMKHMVGIFEPDRGEIVVDGIKLTGSDEKTRISVQSKFGILFQGAALFDSMNIYDNVAFGLRRKGMRESEVKEIVAEMLGAVGLRGVDEKSPSELSGGMQKRAGLARSLAVKPEIMLYDEPTTGVDPITGGVVDRLIVSTRERFGITSVVVTHDMHSAMRIADRIAMLYEGKIIFKGTPEEMKETDNVFVRQFVEGKSAGPIRVI